MNFFAILFLYYFGANAERLFEQHFATKTPYRVVANEEDSEVRFQGCEPVKIWYVVRHGTRTPTEKGLREMKKFLPNILKRIISANEFSSNPLIEDLKKWKLEYADTVLTDEGANEQQALAKRMQNRFPTLFPKTFSNDTYLFRFTNTQRTQASAENFSIGLFGREGFDDVYFPTPMTVDPVLRFYRLCRRWKVEVEDVHSKEQARFHRSDYVYGKIREMSKALNLTRSLSVDEVHAIYQTCSIDTANNKNSVWCRLIPMDMIKIMEFSQALLYDHKHGYVNEISSRQGCPLLQHMVQFFDSEPDGPSAAIMFTHDSALLTFLSHLGLFKNDKKLQHSDFYTGFDNKWKISEIGAFASNIAFVLYRCSDVKKVAVFYQERLVQLPNCPELCDYDDIKKNYHDSIYRCQFDEMCNLR